MLKQTKKHVKSSLCVYLVLPSKFDVINMSTKTSSVCFKMVLWTFLLYQGMFRFVLCQEGVLISMNVGILERLLVWT